MTVTELKNTRVNALVHRKNGWQRDCLVGGRSQVGLPGQAGAPWQGPSALWVVLPASVQWGAPLTEPPGQ